MTPASPPDNYYLNYFLQMVELVTDRYGDILSPDDSHFLNQMKATSQESLRLLIRLYIRKGPNFLSHKLNYNEVPNISTCIDELVENELLEKDPLVYAFELIDLLPIAQSRQLFSSDNPKIKKSELHDLWFEDDSIKCCTDWGVTDQIICPADYDSYRRLQLLYFGNEHQNLTEFVLEDLGLFKYEKHLLSRKNRLFNDTEDIDTIIQINDLASEFYLMNDAREWDELPILASTALALKPSEPIEPRLYRLLNRIGYRLEQLNQFDQAEKLFKTNSHPPSRERLARIFFKRERYQSSLDILTAIKDHPFAEQEIAFYRRFINKVLVKLDRPKITIEKIAIEEFHISWVRFEGSVEQQACEKLGDAVWLENNLPLAVFGLIYWPVIFADIPGVWHHPFQVGPADLKDDDFISKRAAYHQDLNSKSTADWRAALIECWKSKENIRNPFVNWSVLSLDVVLTCFDSLTRTQWNGLFNHLLMDIKNHRSGFPDLFQCTKTSYRFIEIKGPGDKLQDNQITWLNVFGNLGINAEVCYVTYDD